jgi:hypothetical protein
VAIDDAFTLVTVGNTEWCASKTIPRRPIAWSRGITSGVTASGRKPSTTMSTTAAGDAGDVGCDVTAGAAHAASATPVKPIATVRWTPMVSSRNRGRR